MRDQAALIRAVPPNTCVEADDRLAAQLTHTNLVTLPTLLGRAPDFIALDLSETAVGGDLPSPAATRQSALAKGYRPIFERGSLVLLASPNFSGQTASCRP